MTIHNRTLLKIIAIIAMTVDHIGYLYFPSIKILRCIGRIAFPIFAYQLAESWNKTSDRLAYLKRLLFFGLISQPMYYIAFDSLKANIFITLLLGIIFISIYDRYRSYCLNLIVYIFLIYLDTVFPYDWGAVGILIIFSFSLALKNDKTNIVLGIILYIGTVGYQIINVPEIWYIYSFELLSFLIIMVFRYKKNIFKNINFNINKYIFYIYYPCHLLGLGILTVLINKYL